MSINSVTGNTLLESGMFAPCRAATTAAIALSGLQTTDGVALNAGDRVLVWQQADATTNGIYAASSGTWVRTTDAASNASFYNGMAVMVAEGAAWSGTLFLCTATDDPVVIGTSLLSFESQSAVQAGQQSATSSTTASVATGSATFQIAAGLAFKAGQWVVIQETSNPANVLLAQISSYAGTALAVNVVATGGSGSHGDWTIVLANSQASAGIIPPVGSGNVTGPGSSTAGHIATYADGTGKVLADSGTPAGTLAGRNQLLYGDAGAGSIPQSALAPGAAPLPFVAAQLNDNLHLSNDGTNPTRDLDISPGRVRDDSDVTNLHLAGTMVKRLDTAWAAGGVAGSPAGGCDSGTKGASQTWHMYLIGKLGQSITAASRTSSVATVTVAGHGAGVGTTARISGIGSGFDGIAVITAVTTNTISYANTGSNASLTPGASAVLDLFDTLGSQSYPSPSMPSGWTAKQCLGAVLTDSSANIIAFFQYGDEFWLNSPIASVTIFGTGTTLATVNTPAGVKVQAFLNVTGTTNTGAGNEVVAVFLPGDSTVTGVGTSSSPGAQIAGLNGSTVTYGVTPAAQITCWTNAVPQVRVNTAINSGILYAFTTGWRHPCRRLF
jgi:hypothetical protein